MKIISSTPEFTFDDILLLPGKSDFLPPQENELINLKTKVSKNLSIDIPIVSSPMPGVTEEKMAIAIASLGGLGFIHPFQSFDRQLAQVSEVKQQKLKVAACVFDLKDTGIKHVGNLLKAGADLIAVESGHAHNLQTIEFIKKLKKTYKKIEITVSLVVTGEATEDLIKAGADSIRVGIGGGSHCTTRLVTGIGRPQLSAVQECANVAKKYKVPVISDTGIKYAGDIPKALAFGAGSVMIGGLFTGTDECPGEIIYKDGEKYKMTWGMCTDTAMRHKQLKQILKLKPSAIKNAVKDLLNFEQKKAEKKLFEEGVEKAVPYKGSVTEVVDQLISGTKRSMWYMGVKNIESLQKNARVVITTSNTHQDNIPRI